MMTMPPNASAMPSRRFQRIVSPRSQTESSVENGTPICVAIATVEASSALRKPTNKNANATGPMSAVPATR